MQLTELIHLELTQIIQTTKAIIIQRRDERAQAQAHLDLPVSMIHQEWVNQIENQIETIKGGNKKAYVKTHDNYIYSRDKTCDLMISACLSKKKLKSIID